MSEHIVLIPKTSHSHTLKGNFEWVFDEGNFRATANTFYLSDWSMGDKPQWVFSGSIGQVVTDNYVGFLFMIPYINNEPLERSYQLSDGLYASYSYSIPPPPQYHTVRQHKADSATLKVKLDPSAGTVEATFEATFTIDSTEKKATGQFNLLQDDLASEPGRHTHAS